MSETDTPPSAPPADFWRRDDTIKRVIAKLNAKKERQHDLSGVHYPPDQDCRMAVWVIQALVAQRDVLKTERSEWRQRAQDRCLEADRLLGKWGDEKARAEAAEAQLRDPLSDPRVKALVSEVGKHLVKMEATGFPTQQLYGLRSALADVQKEQDT